MIKTTKTDFKQKQVFHDTMDVEGKATFGGDVKVDGKVIVNSGSDIVDKDGNASVVTIADEQTIVGHKLFKGNDYGDYKHYGLRISDDAESNENMVGDTIYPTIRGIAGNLIFTCATASNCRYTFMSNKDNEYIQFSWNRLTTKGLTLAIGSSPVWKIISFGAMPTSRKEYTIAYTEDLNKTTALTLTNVSGHRYTGTISTSNKVECIVDIDDTYTANFNIAKGMKTAFLMVYGTSSTDVATCFATMDSSGLVTIDLDNVSLSSFTPTCKYIIYN